MKSNNDFRSQMANTADSGKKAVKLAPIRKSGKEKHTLYKGLSHPKDEDDEDFDLSILRERDSILDYMGDEEEEDSLDEDFDDEDEDDDDDEGEEDEEGDEGQ